MTGDKQAAIMPKQDINRTREPNDPSAFSEKPMLDEHQGAGLRGLDKQQDKLTDPHQSKSSRHNDHDANELAQKQRGR